MRYLSVCSGIEAATVAWEPLGWQPVAFSEIEKFPCAVLKHHYPDVPNLGDMNRYKEWDIEPGAVDLLVGGTPCQSFSVAGLRKGLDDPRGNLALVYLGIVERLRPRWIVWENVPGVLSSGGGRDFGSFLGGLGECGYIIDIDILDAQFHGVPQRRRRVFVCGQNRDDLLRQKTDSSALTIAQCLQEILHGILIEKLKASGEGQASSDSAYLSKDGILRRMRLFGLLGGNNNWLLLLNNLAEAYQRCQVERNRSDAPRGVKGVGWHPGDPYQDSVMENPSGFIEPSLRKVLGEAYSVMRSFITSTGTSSTTTSEIYTCTQAVLLIARLIVHLSQSSPCFWSAASSSLIALKEFMSYARQASSDLFGELEWVSSWCNFIREAEQSINIIRNIGAECFGQVLSIPESLCGDTPPRRKTREEIAGTIKGGSGIRGVDSDQIANGNYVTGTISPGAHPGSYNGQDASNNLLVPVAYNIHTNDGGNVKRKDRPNGGFYVSEADKSLAIGSPNKTLAIGINGSGVGFALRSNASHSGDKGDGGVNTTLVAQIADCLTKDWINSNGAKGGNNAGVINPVIHRGMVRRLTPTECERLQGFTDNYTRIPYRGKPAEQCPDGPRYKALGNSMAVPVMRWIGERIQQVAEISLDGESGLR